LKPRRFYNHCDRRGADNGDVKMKSKLMLLATAAILAATNAQARFLTPESQRCTSSRPHGILKPPDWWLGGCDLAANRADAYRRR
jgi:hypothetical protein